MTSMALCAYSSRRHKGARSVTKKRHSKKSPAGPKRPDTPMQPPSSGRKRSWMVSIGVLAVVGLGAMSGWWWYHSARRAEETAPSGKGRSPAQDPRLTFATPFLDVRPEVKYVGDEVCAGCHEGHAKTFRQHPMGRSLAPLSAATPVERLKGPASVPSDVAGTSWHDPH